MLQGYRVLDCSDRLGWLAGRILADLGADVAKLERSRAQTEELDWQAYNVNKGLLVFDRESEAGLRAFNRIVSAVDVVIACPQPGDNSAAEAFDYRRLSRSNAGLVLALITRFGNEGPRAHWRASDIELMAAGGAMSLAGEPNSTPVRISAPQSYSWAGVHAAVGALMALNSRRVTGRGQEVHVSAQASVLPALAFAPSYWDMDRSVPTRAGSYAPGRSVTGARYRAFWPCKDGYVNFIVYGGAAGRRTNKRLVEWMKERGADLGVLAHIDWGGFDPVAATQAEVDAIEEPIGRFFATLTKRDFLDGASSREMLGYPVFTVADIARDPQLEARAFWSDLAGPGGSQQRHCGSFYLIDGERPPLRRPLSEADQEGRELLRELGFTDAEIELLLTG